MSTTARRSITKRRPIIKTLIIGDTHGSVDALLNIHAKAGINVDNRDDWVVYHVGDLLNCAPYGFPYRGFLSYDLATLNLAFKERMVDKCCVGNHEAFFLYGWDVGKWFGMATILQPELQDLIEESLDAGFWAPAIHVNDHTLITHAGISKVYESEFMHLSASDAVEAIQHYSYGNTIHDDENGILWNRGPCAATSFMQVYGHTPDSSHPKQYADGSWNIDSGGYINGIGSGVVIDSDGSFTEL